MPTNREGLTYKEWLAASGCEELGDNNVFRKAWRNGEDPTEWRSSYDAVKKAFDK